MAGKATFLRKLDGWRGDANLYRVEPSMPFTQMQSDDESFTDHVIVSAVDAFGEGEETYIFPSDASGKSINMLEMDGSFKGEMDHARALSNAGYDIVDVSRSAA